MNTFYMLRKAYSLSLKNMALLAVQKCDLAHWIKNVRCYNKLIHVLISFLIYPTLTNNISGY